MLNGMVNEYVVGAEHLQTFKKIESNHVHINQKCKTEVGMLERIMQIADAHPLTTNDVSAAIPYDSPILPALWAMFRVYIMQCNKKNHCVWIHGRANSGKSYIGDQLAKIFHTDVFADSESKYVASKARGEFKT